MLSSAAAPAPSLALTVPQDYNDARTTLLGVASSWTDARGNCAGMKVICGYGSSVVVVKLDLNLGCGGLMDVVQKCFMFFARFFLFNYGGEIYVFLILDSRYRRQGEAVRSASETSRL